VPEKTFQHRLDCVRSTEGSLYSRAPAAQSKDDEIADGCVPGTLAVDDDGNTALEIRLADEELAAAGELADG
jgi:hypothetical protein